MLAVHSIPYFGHWQKSSETIDEDNQESLLFTYYRNLYIMPKEISYDKLMSYSQPPPKSYFLPISPPQHYDICLPRSLVCYCRHDYIEHAAILGMIFSPIKRNKTH